MTEYDRVMDQGYEGQILRINNEYQNKRSKYLLKHKTFVDEEFVILGINEGEGNKSGMIGYALFETKEGKLKGKVKLYVKYMVSHRCKLMVKEELKNLGIKYVVVDLGEVEILEDITIEQRANLKANLLLSAFLILDLRRDQVYRKNQGFVFLRQ